MSERLDGLAGGDEVTASMERDRLLTEVDHLLANRRPDGGFEPEAEQDILTNLRTALQEMAMPYAVSQTVQRAEHVMDEAGRRQRLFTWLGRCAVQVAESGYGYHASEPALRRVEVEVAEARHSQYYCRPGVAQPFISPKMSASDAPPEVAEAEHLADDDAVRVAFAVTDNQGRVVARRLESLLVRDVPLSAWVAMLTDPANLFGRPFELRDVRSAVSVMELFERMEIAEEALPEGPVTLVRAVAAYITDDAARSSVERQLRKFRGDQAAYAQAAAERAAEWLAFERELACSLHEGRASLEIERFIAQLQHQWGDDDLRAIRSHDLVGGGYAMSRELAARLEKAQQNVLAGIAAIQTGNDQVLEQMDTATSRRLRDEIRFIETARAGGAAEAEIRNMQARLVRGVARQNLSVGGGCPGKNEGSFRDGGSGDGADTGGERGLSGGGDKSQWKWKKGVCRVPNCPSPKPTEVGPCDVCRGCQKVFDSGGNPTKQSAPRPMSRPVRVPASIFKRAVSFEAAGGSGGDGSGRVRSRWLQEIG